MLSPTKQSDHEDVLKKSVTFNVKTTRVSAEGENKLYFSCHFIGGKNPLQKGFGCAAGVSPICYGPGHFQWLHGSAQSNLKHIHTHYMYNINILLF